MFRRAIRTFMGGAVAAAVVLATLAPAEADEKPTAPSAEYATESSNKAPESVHQPTDPGEVAEEPVNGAEPTPPPPGSLQAERLAAVRTEIQAQVDVVAEQRVEDVEPGGRPQGYAEPIFDDADSPAQPPIDAESESSVPTPTSSPEPDGSAPDRPGSGDESAAPTPTATPAATVASAGLVSVQALQRPTVDAAAAGVCDPVPGAPYGTGYTVLSTPQNSLPRANGAGYLRVEVFNRGTQSWPSGSQLSYTIGGVYGPLTTISTALNLNQSTIVNMRVNALPPGEHRLELDLSVPGVGWLTGQAVCRYPIALVLQNWQPSATYEAPMSPGGSVTTRTPFLKVSGSDPDQWPSALTYQFKICRDVALTNGCITSSWLSERSWQTPALEWGGRYYWVASVSDGQAITAGTIAQDFTVVIPAPDEWRAVGNGRGLATYHGVVLPSGVYVNTVRDVEIPDARLPLYVERTYSSGAMTTEGAFGKGWLSIFDAGLVRNASSGLLTVTYPDGRQESFGRNSSGQWIARAELGLTTRISEDSAGRITIKQSSGEVVVYDNSGRLTSVSYPTAGAWELTYANGRITRLTHQSSRRYIEVGWVQPTDSCGANRPTRPYVGSLSVDAGGGQLTRWAYAYSCSTLISMTDPLGAKTTYDSKGTTRTPEGRLLAGYSWENPSWFTTSEPIPGGSSYRPNRQERTVTLTEPGSSADRKVTLIRAVPGYESDYAQQFNPYGGVTVVLCPVRFRASAGEACGTYTTMQFDVQGRLRNQALRPKGRVAAVNGTFVSPLQGERIWLYGAVTRRLDAMIDENANLVEYTYDGWGNPTGSYTFRDPDTQVTSRSYYQPESSAADAPMRLTGTSITPIQAQDYVQASEFIEQYAYDAHGRLLSRDGPTLPGLPDGEQTTHTYTDGTEPAVDGNGLAVTGQRMPAGLMRTTTTAAGTTTYSYDQRGDRTLVTEPGGSRVAQTYDARGLTIRQIANGAARIEYQRDLAGRIVAENHGCSYNEVTGIETRRVVSREYDRDGLQTKITERAVDCGNGTDTDPARTTRFVYTGQARLSQVIDPAGGTTTYEYSADNPEQVIKETDARGRVLTRVYSAVDGRLTEIQQTTGVLGSVTTARTLFTYDYAGRKIREVDPLGRATTFSYTWDDYAHTATRSNVLDQNGVYRSVQMWNRSFDGAGRITRETVGASRTTEYEYDADGRLLTTALDPGGLARTTTITRDAAGRTVGMSLYDNERIEQTDFSVSAAGHVTAESRQLENGQVLRTEYQRDLWGNATRTIDPRGAAGGTATSTYSSYSYADDLGRVVMAGTAAGTVDRPTNTTDYTGLVRTNSRSWSYAGYNAFGEVTARQDATGRILSVEYDAGGRIIVERMPSYTPPRGTTITPEVRHEYNAAGDRVRTIDARGRVTDFQYDVDGRVTRIMQPAVGGQRPVTEFVYNAGGELTRTKSPTGAVTTYGYDALGRKVAETVSERVDPLNASSSTVSRITSYAYDDAGNLVATTTPEGRRTRFEYNAAAEVTAVWHPGRTSPDRIEYDVAGRKTREADGAGRAVEHVYDLAGREIETAQVGSDGARLVTQSEYDLAGNLVARTDPRGATTRFTVDANNRITQMSQQLGPQRSIITEAGYDNVGNQIRTRNGNGADTWTTYNAWGLPERVIEPSTPRDPAMTNRSWTTAYDAALNPISTTKPGNVQINREFDALNRLTREAGSASTEALAAERWFEYDLDGRVTRARTAARDERYVWNDRALLATATSATGGQSFGYDGDGNLTRRTLPEGTTNFGYNGASQLVSMTSPSFSGPFSRTYTPDSGQLATQTGTGGTTAYGYDSFGRNTSIAHRNPSGVLSQDELYEYDANGNVTSKRSTADVQYGGVYSYDMANRLTTFSPRDGDASTGIIYPRSYQWDDANNRVRESINVTSTTWSYDARNRLDTSAFDGDYGPLDITEFGTSPRGSITSVDSDWEARTLQFDVFDQLVGDSRSSGTKEYDALGRLARSNSQSVVYAGLRTEPHVFPSTLPGAIERAAYTPDGSLLQTWSQHGSRTALVNAHGDHVGGMAVMGGSPESMLTRTGTVGFEPFGSLAAGSTRPGGTGVEQPSALGFQGDFTDPRSDAVYMGARWYDPSLGMFLSRDDTAIPYTGTASLNLNGYANGNPMSMVDPDGRFAFVLPFFAWAAAHPILTIVGGSIGLAALGAGIQDGGRTPEAIRRGIGNFVGSIPGTIRTITETVARTTAQAANVTRTVVNEAASVARTAAQQAAEAATRTVAQTAAWLRSMFPSMTAATVGAYSTSTQWQQMAAGSAGGRGGVGQGGGGQGGGGNGHGGGVGGPLVLSPVEVMQTIAISPVAVLGQVTQALTGTMSTPKPCGIGSIDSCAMSEPTLGPACAGPQASMNICLPSPPVPGPAGATGNSTGMLKTGATLLTGAAAVTTAQARAVATTATTSPVPPEDPDPRCDPDLDVEAEPLYKGDVSVYQSRDVGGQTDYVGISNDVSRRSTEHQRSKGITIEKIRELPSFDRSSAKAVEQVLIELNDGPASTGGTQLRNKRNSISPNNPIYGKATASAKSFLRDIGFC